MASSTPFAALGCSTAHHTTLAAGSSQRSVRAADTHTSRGRVDTNAATSRPAAAASPAPSLRPPGWPARGGCAYERRLCPRVCVCTLVMRRFQRGHATWRGTWKSPSPHTPCGPTALGPDVAVVSAWGGCSCLASACVSCAVCPLACSRCVCPGLGVVMWGRVCLSWFNLVYCGGPATNFTS